MLKIFRIRYIPSETVDLSGDQLLYRDEAHLVTAWQPIRPRTDFDHGMSCVFLDEGTKLSRFMDAAGETLYWYVDLVDVSHDSESDTYRLHDLLADVRILPDGQVEVTDLDELADALEQKLISEHQAVMALRILHRLLSDIHSGVQPSLAAEWMEKATKKSMDKSAEQAMKKSMDKTAEQAMEKGMDKTAEQAMEKGMDKTTEKAECADGE